MEVIAETDNFLIKTASTFSERVRSHWLRYQIFHLELAGKKWPYGFDYDVYDNHADHLLVIEKKTKNIAGYYRLIVTSNLNDLYSSSEFYFTPFELNGLIIELSRACVRPEYRRKPILPLLWKGIGHYIVKKKADVLMGIPSISGTDKTVSVPMFKYFLDQGLVSEDIKAVPWLEHQVMSTKRWDFLPPLPEDFDAKKQIPPLFAMYLKAGAKVIGPPAFDHDLNCTDFPIALKVDELTPPFRRKYLPSE